MPLTTIETIPAGYDVRCAKPLQRLHGHLYDLVHRESGARHLHLAVPDKNNYFCALYRTPPDDSTGAPHIMEHCVSGGSRRFPPGAGGDMYTRSLLTDVNGMTSADHTTFYIATRNKQDYMNWLEYIVDVTLFPRMEEDTFLRQRGHFEFNTPDDSSSGLRFTGTVYNEMKAVFGAPARHTFAALNRELFAGHPYRHSAGGDPAEMPSLSYQGILAFFKQFYHPVNAVFVSRGDVPLPSILERVEEIVGKFGIGRDATDIPDVPRRSTPTVATAPLPVGEDAETPGYVVLGWALPMVSGNSYDRLLLDVAGDVLLEGDASPVRQAIRESGLVRGAVDTTRAAYRNPLVAIVAADTDPADADDLERIVLDAIARAAHDGLEASSVDDAIARLELRRRDQANGIAVFLDTVFPPLLYGGDPFSALELDGDLSRLQAERERSRPLEDFIDAQLVRNMHRVRVDLYPDADLEKRVVQTEARWVAEAEAKLTDADRAEIAAQAKRLAEPPPQDYPRRGLTPEDGLTLLETPDGLRHDVAGVPVEVFDQPTDGITHLWLRIDASDVADDDIPCLGLLCAALERDATAGSPRVAGLDVRGHARVHVTGDRTVHWLELTGRTLVRDQDELVRAVASVLRGPRQSDLARLIAARASALEQGIMPNAQVHLRRLSGRPLRRSSAIDDATKGFGQLRFLKHLAKTDTKDVEGRLARLGEELIASRRIAVCLTGGGRDIEAVLGPLSDSLTTLPLGGDPRPTVTDRIGPPYAHVARIAQLPVAFTCEAHAIPGLDHPDAAAIAVLTQLMFSGYLNTEIRRGGAYGVDFEVLPERGLWWMSSRRDPLPVNTYRAFTEAIDRFRSGSWDVSTAKDGMLAILRMTDPVDTPASSARRAWLSGFTGHTTDLWNAFRQRILGVRDKDLQRVADEYFSHPSRATLLGRTMLDADAELGSLFDEIEDV